jgi:uridine kinase
VKTKVILIGGAPGTGKTTLGSALAVRLGTTSLSIDDLLTAAMAVTTPESHPGLHFKKGVPFQEYFTNSSLEQLKKTPPHNMRRHGLWLSGLSASMLLGNRQP